MKEEGYRKLRDREKGTKTEETRDKIHGAQRIRTGPSYILYCTVLYFYRK
jgi:hypothetical protein